MQDYLKKYEVTITTKGPIYIGSGNTINKKEYYIDTDEERVYLFNPIKIFKEILKRGLEEKYIKYMHSPGIPMNLGEFLNKNGIGIMKVKQMAEYSISAANLEESIHDFKKKSRNINTFISEAGNNKYIPGSSLKGALRTALIVDEIYRNKFEYNKFSEISMDIEKDAYSKRIKNIGNYAEKIENKALRTLNRKDTKKEDPVNDIMSCIRVGDSEVIPNENMTLCQRIDKFQSKLNDDNFINILPIYYECIKPNVSIKTNITIDTSLSNDISIDRIKRAIATYSKVLDDEFNSKFDSEYCCENVMFIGGYTGYPSKTLLYSLLDDNKLDIIRRVINSNSKHDHLKDEISPRTMKFSKYLGKEESGDYEIGRIEIEFKEI